MYLRHESSSNVQMMLHRDKFDEILREGSGMVELSVDKMVLNVWSPGSMFLIDK
jgi:hypothetical protein